MKKKVDKFSSDAIFNLAAVGGGGVLYILMNTIILSSYGEEVLGIFNLVYAIYMVLSQVAIFGVHLSVQTQVPALLKDREAINQSLSAALIFTLCFSVALVLICYPFNDLIAESFNMPDVEIGLNYCLWGMVLFSLNKVLMAYLNGSRQMRGFAVFTFLRLFLMLSFAIVLIWMTVDAAKLSLLFGLTESVLFILLLIEVFKTSKFRINQQLKSLILEHFKFGRSAFVGNLLLDINTRVDVIMLGYLMNESAVGIYSFVLSVSHGIIQIPVVFRNNINPIITKASVMKNVSGQLGKMLKKNIRNFYKVIGALALGTILLYPFGLMILGIEAHFYLYWQLYAIIVGGIIVSAGYQPLSMLFNQLKLPQVQSTLFFLLFIINIIANYAFISWVGIYGAAIGTAISYISLIFLIKILANKHYKLKL